MKLAHREMKVVGTHLMNVTGDDTRRERFIIGVGGDHTDTNLSRECIDLLCRDVIVH
jgi:hypothetical protein